MNVNEVINQDFFKIAQKIREHGGHMYLVGGAVRDLLLRKNAP